VLDFGSSKGNAFENVRVSCKVHSTAFRQESLKKWGRGTVQSAFL